MIRRLLVLPLLILLLGAGHSYSQQNGKLQIHFMDVGQGDGALLISPAGETVLFDDGVRNNCEQVKAYIQQLGVTQIDYHIASHYHDDHIGCAVQVLEEFPLKKSAYDLGFSYKTKTATFTNYTNYVGSLRKTAVEGASLTLDKNSALPVKIEFAAMNGNGIAAYDENALSLVCVVRFGQFDAVIGGDLSGVNGGGYKDIETSVAPKVGQVEVYKVNHHGSRYSSNPVWLQKIKPKIGIISCGDGNKHHHPTSECLDRLHAAGITTYWTERGNGAPPKPGSDKVGGSIVVETSPGETTFTVKYGGNQIDSYQVWNAVGAPGVTNSYAWSKKAKWYHFANCKYVESISLENIGRSNSPPADKDLHIGCPK